MVKEIIWFPNTPVLNLLIEKEDFDFIYYMKPIIDEAIKDVGLVDDANTYFDFKQKDVDKVVNLIDNLKSKGFKQTNGAGTSFEKLEKNDVEITFDF
jgi:citrate lyase alpha subunit